MANEKITDLPSASSASLTDIIYAVQGYVSPSAPGTSVQETLQQVANLMLAQTILNNAGNPNGVVAGNVYQLCWDKTNNILYVCTTSGSTSTAVWTQVAPGFGSIVSPAHGGTGINNGTSTITIGGNFAMSGAHTFTGTLTGDTSVTFPTSGTLATTSQLPTGAALTETNDTNVTLTLGGSAATALVNAASITAGWMGQLAPSRGGTGVSSPTAHSLPIAEGASNYNFVSLTNGQLLIGSTGADPVATTITPGAGISIVNGAGSITISGTGSGIGWQTVAASGGMTADNGYITTGGALVSLSLPATAAVGTGLAVIGSGAGGWSITTGGGQTMQVGTSTASTSVSSTNRYDSVYFICTTANTVWTVLGSPQSSGLTIV